MLLLAISVVTSTAVPACGTTDAACGPVVHDALDPGSGTHVLPGTPTPSYLTDPPTSGAHQPGPQIDGPLADPLAPQLQVGVLEEGRVMIQYADVSSAEIARLAKLNSADVLVAPAERLPNGTKVVATAWVTHQACSAVDIATLEEFATRQAGRGPGAD